MFQIVLLVALTFEVLTQVPYHRTSYCTGCGNLRVVREKDYWPWMPGYKYDDDKYVWPLYFSARK